MSIKIETSQKFKNKKKIESDPFFKEVSALNISEIDNWLETNLKNINDVKKLCSFLLKQNYHRENLL